MDPFPFFPHHLLHHALKHVDLPSWTGFPIAVPSEIGERLCNASPRLMSPAGMVYVQPFSGSALSFPSLGPCFMIQLLETRVIEIRNLVQGAGHFGVARVPQRCCTAGFGCRAQPARGECPPLRGVQLHRQSTWPLADFIFFFSSFCSGGVMIYFDRIEVVNFLIQSAGEFFPCDLANPAIQSCLCSC